MLKHISKHYIDMKFSCGCKLSVVYIKELFKPEYSYTFEDQDIVIKHTTLCQDCESILNNELTSEEIHTILEEIAYDVLTPLDNDDKIDTVSDICFKHPLSKYVLSQQELEYETVLI